MHYVSCALLKKYLRTGVRVALIFQVLRQMHAQQLLNEKNVCKTKGVGSNPTCGESSVVVKWEHGSQKNVVSHIHGQQF